MLQERAKRLNQFVIIDLVRLITLVEFGAKKYFFMFTNNNTYTMETYIGRQKSK